jgi:hypothetical protein
LSKNQQIIFPTKNTPEVILDDNGTIKLTGRLIPNYADDFFYQLEVLLNEYFCNPAEITYVEICLEYINSLGTKYLLDLIYKITYIHLKKNTKKFIINWYYKDEDEDMLEKGTFLSSDLDLLFNYIKII